MSKAKPIRELRHKVSHEVKDKVEAAAQTPAISPYTWRTKIQDDWIPMPADALATLGWAEGTELELFPITGNQIVIRKRGALQDAP